MLGFLPLQRQNSQRWLSPDPSWEQEQFNSIQERKRELRLILRETRGKLKTKALEDGLPWGAQHTNELLRFLTKQGILPVRAQIQPHPARDIGVYWPIGSELDLRPQLNAALNPEIIQDSRTEFSSPTIRWWIPLTAPNRELFWVPHSPDIAHWPRDGRGLPQAPVQTRTQSEPPAILIAPCLAVDHTGIRLGYGGGYYDKLISKYDNVCLIIACIPSQLFLESNAIPREIHDAPVDVVVTQNTTTIIDEKKFNTKKEIFRQTATNC